MTTTPSPAEFLAQPHSYEEDFEPVELTPLESIAESLRTIARINFTTSVTDAVERPETDPEAPTEMELRTREVGEEWMQLAVARQALLDEVLKICKPSTSKLANAIRAVLDPPAVGEPPAEHKCARCDGAFPDVVALQAHGTRAHGADFDYRDGGAEPTTKAEIAAVATTAVDKGTAYELGPDATVETWRAYARMFGYLGYDVDKAEIPYIRTMLGLPAPAAVEQPHNHDFRTGETPDSCACGYTLSTGARS